MSESGSRPKAVRAAVTGVILVLAGSLALLALVYIGNSRSSLAERALIDVGLAGSVLISALAQVAVLFGVWLLWRAVHRPRA